MKILIVDDHPIYAEGLKNLLISWSYEEVEIARDGAEAIERAKNAWIDVILMDINLPGIDGIGATQEIKGISPDTKIVMLTSLGDEESLLRAVRAGASGYLLKTLDGKELARCLADLEAGKNPFSAGLEESLLSELRRGTAPLDGSVGARGLTFRQREVLKLLAKGNNYKQIGVELFISERTVKFHIEGAKEALGLKTKEELISYIERV